MSNLFMRFWQDDAGFVLSSELLFYFVIILLAVAFGFAQIRVALVTELTEAAANLAMLDNSLSFPAFASCASAISGYSVQDNDVTPGITSPAVTPVNISANPAGSFCP